MIENPDESIAMSRQLVQYVVVRKDLVKVLGWSIGAVIAQACHACTAVIHMFYQEPCTQEYLQDLDNMHKIILEVPDESSLLKLQSQLKASEISHKLWIEQPENIPTCFVLKPYPKQDVQQYFQGLKLFTLK
uniref:peptidyl-tRNA hydrolase n=3 Tax=Timema TaxID=61471 RepID=A0A7R9B164_TIMSH|nr:unnamed protein product [Timema shepardi]CAD7575066.1 unnamed protein product [Timema californicum]